MTPARTLRSLTSLVFLLGSTAAWCAQSYTVHLNGANGAAIRYVSPHAVRYVEPTAKRDMLFLFDQGTIIHIDHASRSYAEVKISDLQHSLASHWSTIDPQKKALLQRLGFGAPSTVTPLGPGESILGYATDRYLIKTAVMQLEVYAAPQLEVPRGYYDVVGIATRYPGQSRDGGNSPLDAIKGCVLREVMVGPGHNGGRGGPSAIDTVTAVEVGPIPASEFTVPPGYQKKELPH